MSATGVTPGQTGLVIVSNTGWTFEAIGLMPVSTGQPIAQTPTATTGAQTGSTAPVTGSTGVWIVEVIERMTGWTGMPDDTIIAETRATVEITRSQGVSSI